MHSRADVLSDTKYEDEGGFHAGYENASSHACALLPVAVSPGLGLALGDTLGLSCVAP